MDLIMNALRGRVSSDLDNLVHRTNSPFTTFFPPTAEVSYATGGKLRRKQGPLDHLESFMTLMHLQGISDKIMYRAFPTTLKGPARI